MAAIKTIHQIHGFLHRFPTPDSQVPHMNELTLQTPECSQPLDQPSRYKAAFGGRGSGKSWHFASMVVEHCLTNPGAKVVCIREVQKTLNQSAKALIELKIQELGVGSQFRVLFDRIETPGGGLIIFQGMQDMNAESIKSIEGYNIAWVEEAQTLSARNDGDVWLALGSHEPAFSAASGLHFVLFNH